MLAAHINFRKTKAKSLRGVLVSSWGTGLRPAVRERLGPSGALGDQHRLRHDEPHRQGAHEVQQPVADPVADHGPAVQPQDEGQRRPMALEQEGWPRGGGALTDMEHRFFLWQAEIPPHPGS